MKTKNIALISLLTIALASCNHNEERDVYETINFGQYPQTLVTDEALLEVLPDAVDSDGDGYFNYEDKEYARINGRNVNGYSSTTIYYFEVLPISWDVMPTGELFSSKIIDALMLFSNRTSSKNYDDRTINESRIYPNNYEYSSARAFLNSINGLDYEISNYARRGFYNNAFSTEEQDQILTSEVDNSASSTHKNNNQYASNNTTDKVYLYSYQEVISKLPKVANRVKTPTDYALCRGLYHDYYDDSQTPSSSMWWTRSPYDQSFTTSIVNSDGTLTTGNIVSLYHGLCPVMRISR